MIYKEQLKNTQAEMRKLNAKLDKIVSKSDADPDLDFNRHNVDGVQYHGILADARSHYTAWSRRARTPFGSDASPNRNNPRGSNNDHSTSDLDEIDHNELRARFPTHMPDSWYLRNFEGPWKVIPDPPGDHKERYEKLDLTGLDVFDGNSKNYPHWENQFINMVHTACCTTKKKLQALLKLLNRQNPDITVCIPYGDWNPNL